MRLIALEDPAGVCLTGTPTMKKAATAMKKRKSGSEEEKGGDAPSQLIDARIKELSDWRGETLARIRSLIKEADPDVVEEWKWRGVPVWSHAGIICTGETYKNAVKMTFAKGASVEDPSHLFNPKFWKRDRIFFCFSIACDEKRNSVLSTSLRRATLRLLHSLYLICGIAA